MVHEINSKFESLHILVNNAGARYMTRQESVEGFEMTFALNYLAYFLLSNLLLDVLKGSAPAQIINVASGTHNTEINFSDLQGEDNYDGRRAYAQ